MKLQELNAYVESKFSANPLDLDDMERAFLKTSRLRAQIAQMTAPPVGLPFEARDLAAMETALAKYLGVKE